MIYGCDLTPEKLFNIDYKRAALIQQEGFENKKVSIAITSSKWYLLD